MRIAAFAGLAFLHLPILLIFVYAFTTEDRTYQWPPPGLTLNWFAITWNRADVWQAMVKRAVDRSFNAITVDGDTSTNDTCCLLASGASGAKVASPRDARTFAAALNDVCRSLAYQIAADGEGEQTEAAA